MMFMIMRNEIIDEKGSSGCMDTVDGYIDRLIIIFLNTSSLLISLLLPSPSSQLLQLIQ